MKRFLPIVFIFTIFMITFVITVKAQSSFAVVNPNGTTTLTESFKTAVETATSGDIIYLPTGDIDIGDFVVKKQVHIIGAGYCPDSSGGAVTKILGDFRIAKGADGGSLTGVAIGGDFRIGTDVNDQNVDGYSCLRCWFGGRTGEFVLGNSTGYAQENNDGKNYTFVECVFVHSWTHISNAKKVLFDRCIFYSRLFNSKGELSIKNSIFLFNISGWPLFNRLEGAIIENCIIIQSHNISPGDCLNTTFNNNLFCSPTTESDLQNVNISGNVFNFDSSKVFLGLDVNNWGDVKYHFSPGDIYHLKPEAKAAIKGTDGREVGLYGGSEPFKDGALPPVPSIKEANVSSKSNAKGKLQIEFKVQAQTK